jgi:hypothetical protein
MQLLIRHTRGATIDRYAHALLRGLYCEAVPDVTMHCEPVGLREIDSMKLDAGHRFREWRYDEALITGIVLAICFPLMLLAVAISGGNKVPICEMYNSAGSFGLSAQHSR